MSDKIEKEAVGMDLVHKKRGEIKLSRERSAVLEWIIYITQSPKIGGRCNSFNKCQVKKWI